MVPYEIAGGSQTEVQTEFQGFYGNRVILPTASAVPGIFTVNASGTGPAVVVNQDGTFNAAENPAPSRMLKKDLGRNSALSLFLLPEASGQLRRRACRGILAVNACF
jgi:hypothetical protein